MPVWFEPKLYGYGAVPVTWQGWAVVGVFIVAVLAAVWWWLGFDRSVKAAPASVVWFLVTVAVLVAVLWVVSQATTSGEWRWRWGSME